MGELVRRAFRRRRLAILAAVACAAALPGATAATALAAKATPVKTKVNITSTSATKFTGTVTSSKPACEKGRKVALYRQISPRLLGADSPDYPGYEPQGATTTDAGGNWEIVASEFFAEGTFRAAVTPKTIVIGGRRYMCSSVWGGSTPA
jgi:hypothetical protein